MSDNQNNTNTLQSSFHKSFKQRLFEWIRLTHQPTVKVYRGFGHPGKITVYGHVFRISPLSRKKYRRNVWTNTLALIRLFIVKPFINVSVELTWLDKTISCVTEKDGFFRFEWKPDVNPEPGWHEVIVSLKNYQRKDGSPILGKGSFFVPYITQYGCISDIDDTFLVSHSSSLWKRLYVLFTENAKSRRPFDGVVKYYQMLAQAGTIPTMLNPFFYVSSSEWNLYDYIVEFCNDNELPSGVYLLNQLKLLHQLVKTGQNKHKTKFFRIVRILEAFPRQRFILLGDDTQEDPTIYQSVVEHFPKQIVCVYIRQVAKTSKQQVLETLTAIELKSIPCCYFKHSEEAVLHSIKIGLITKEKIKETISTPLA